jgi:hypothetical protein
LSTQLDIRDPRFDQFEPMKMDMAAFEDENLRKENRRR